MILNAVAKHYVFTDTAYEMSWFMTVILSIVCCTIRCLDCPDRYDYDCSDDSRNYYKEQS